MRLVLALVGLVSALVVPAATQNPADTSRSAQDSALRVFFDCPGFAQGCDFDYVRTEVTFVNWVRNREDAHVHLLITTQRTGGGGSEYTLSFIGLKQFAGKGDTLRYYSTATQTSDEIRTGMVRVLKLGLARYAAQTPLASQITLTYQPPAGGAAAATPHDPWNYWVFRIQGGTDLSGQSRTKSQSINGSLSANRTTADWKLDFSFDEFYNEDVFKHVPVVDTLGTVIGYQDITSISRQYGADALVVRSLGDHWSAGLTASMNHSTFSNIDLTLSGGPALEYDIYPYSQSTRRQFTAQYSITPAWFDYTDTTIFNKTKETLFRQSLTFALNVTQPWGSSRVSLEASNYLHDFSKNRLVLFGSLNLRLVKGLSLGVFGNVQRIHDQLALQKAGESASEILLRRRELATSYRYFTFISLSYRFGSTLNNVVNPRFGGGGGGFFFSSN